MTSWPEVMNVSQIQSNRQSQVYTFRANSQFDGSYLRRLQNRVTAMLLVHKASKRLIGEIHIGVDFLTAKVQMQTLYITVSPADYCNCCNYSFIKTQPLFALSSSFNACVGNNEAPQACSCSAQSLEVSISYFK